MTTPTHIGFSVLFLTFIIGITSVFTLSWEIVAFAAFGGILPDIDSPVSAIGRFFWPVSSFLDKRFGHRTVTHSFIGTLIIALLFAPLYYYFPNYYYAFIIGYVSHLIIDTFNIQGPLLFWPSNLRCVAWMNRAYRIGYGAKGEYVLMVFIFVGLAVMYPISEKGFMRSVRYVLASMESAVTDFNDLKLTNKCTVELKAVDNISLETIQGEYEVIGALNANELLIRYEDGAKRVGASVDANLTSKSARINEGSKVKYISQKVDMTNRLLSDLSLFMDSSYYQLCFGELVAVQDFEVIENPDYYPTIKKAAKKIRFNYANWDDLQNVLKTNDVYVGSGSLTIRTMIDSTLYVVASDYFREKKLNNRFAEKFDVAFSVGDRSEVVIRRGDHVEKGDIIAVLERYRSESDELEYEMQNIDEQLALLDEDVSYQLLVKQNSIGTLEKRIEEIKGSRSKRVEEYQRKKKELQLDLSTTKQQAEFYADNWNKVSLISANNRITSLENEISQMDCKINSIDSILLSECVLIEHTLQNSRDELAYLQKHDKREPQRLSLLVKRSKLESQMKEFKEKVYVRSQVSGVVSDVNFAMAIEHLIRVQATILTQDG